MNEQVIELLKSDLEVSTDKGRFSTPQEITDWVNLALNAAYSTQYISKILQELGWQVCGKKRAKRKGKAQGFYMRNSNADHKALISPNSAYAVSDIPSTKPESDESMASIERRYRTARASKEAHLSEIRRTEIRSAKSKADHIAFTYAKERGEYIAIDDCVRDWNEALLTLRNELYSLIQKYPTRWASLSDEKVIATELRDELDRMCNKLADSGKEAMEQDNSEDAIYQSWIEHAEEGATV